MLAEIFADYEGVRVYPFSALKGDGAEEIEEAIIGSLS